MFKFTLNPQISRNVQIKNSRLTGFHCILDIFTQSEQRHCRIHEYAYYIKLKQAAITIQKHVRAYQAKKVYARLLGWKLWRIRKEAATLIQAYARGWLGRKKAVFLRLVQTLSLVRNHHAQRIQKQARAFLTRKKVQFYSLVFRISLARTKGTLTIQKFARGFLVRKDMHFIRKLWFKRLILWCYGGSKVCIVGTFSNPPWEHPVPLKYSKYLKDFYTTFFIDNNLSGRFYIKFVVDGDWLCDGNLPLCQDKNGNYNNYIDLEKRAKMRRGGSERTLPTVASREAIMSPLSDTVDSPVGLVVSADNNVKTVKMSFGSYAVAHPKSINVPLSYENSADAFFHNESIQVFGLADGVGEWGTYGLDAKEFPCELMSLCEQLLTSRAENLLTLSEYDVGQTLINVLSEAYQSVVKYGSSTVLLGICTGLYLHTVCLGDSAYIVLRRRGKALNIAFKSTPQQHTFNCPFQLARLPTPEDYPRLVSEGHMSLVSLLRRSYSNSQDMPSDAVHDMISLRQGDIIVAATDGLFDNLFDKDIVNICEQCLIEEIEVDELAWVIAKKLVNGAVALAWDVDYKSPFSKSAAKFARQILGGKLDDTSVIVGVCQ